MMRAVKRFSVIILTLHTLLCGAQSQRCANTFTASECYFTNAAILPPSNAIANSYYIIGGLFDIHTKSGSDICSTTVSQTGLLNLMAFFWSLNKYRYIIGKPDKVSVGAIAFDNCMRPEMTLEHVVGYSQCDIQVQGADQANLVAYVGLYGNEDALRTGSFATDLGVTLVSPSANSMDLNSVDQKTLLRLSPSIAYDMKAIAEFLRHFKSGYVLIVYSSKDPFWKSAFNELKVQLDPSICVQYVADISTAAASQIALELGTRVTAKYVVPLMSVADLDTLLTQMINLSQKSFVFILNSVIGQNRELLRKGYLVRNTVVVDQISKFTNANDLNEFINDMVQKNASLSQNIPSSWLASLTLNQLNQTSSVVLRDISKTIFSVQTIIKAMDTLLQQGCSTTDTNYQFCDAYRNQRAKKDNLFSAIQNEFKLFDGSELSYSNVNYGYYLFDSANEKFDLVGNCTFSSAGKPVASIDDNSLDKSVYTSANCPLPNQNLCCEIITTTSTMSPATITSGATTSDPGMAGRPNIVTVQYPSDQAITGAYSNMARNSSEYGTRFDFGHKWIIAIGVLAGLGILSVIVFEIYILYKLLGTRTGTQWRTMWLGQLLLFGIFLCYLVLFAYLPTPTKATCGIIRFGVGVSYAFCFAVLLVKLMVILTSKSTDIYVGAEGESPNYLKGTYQFLLFVFAVGVQIVIDIQWLITVPPEAIKVLANNGKAMWICNHYTWEAGKTSLVMSNFVRTNFENHVMSLIYIMVMILITTVLSLKAHGIITNHRESIFIGIAAGFSIPVWLAWGLIGGLNRDNKYSEEFGDGAIAFGLLITATLILFSMFLPKVRQLVNMGVEGIYLEDDRETIYGGGSVIMAPSSYKGKGPGSVIYVSNSGLYNGQPLYSDPVIIGNGDPMATHLKHPGSLYGVPPTYQKKAESAYGGSTRVLRVTDDLKGRYPQKRTQSEIAFGSSGKPRSHKGTLPRSRSNTDLGAL